MENMKIIAHVREFAEEVNKDYSLLNEPFLILVQVCHPKMTGWRWVAVEHLMMNSYDYMIYNTVEQAKQALIDEYGAENVVFEQFEHLEVR